MTTEEANLLIPEKSTIIFASGEYVVAGVSKQFGVTWIDIYDEPPSKHVDRLKADSCELPKPPQQ